MDSPRSSATPTITSQVFSIEYGSQGRVVDVGTLKNH
ncbi:hypothetical protein LINPERPRIM_LOCUS20661, partial [Linum perenne]